MHTRFQKASLTPRVYGLAWLNATLFERTHQEVACGKNKKCQLNKKRAWKKSLENMGNNTIPDLADRVVAAERM